jgi:hypothetical protein
MDGIIVHNGPKRETAAKMNLMTTAQGTGQFGLEYLAASIGQRAHFPYLANMAKTAMRCERFAMNPIFISRE